ncbi:dihydrolipoyl dehydrogenase [Rickettsiales endosymbiont of Stachyamoeba lipophora]|uniref:dihydrolipoyl dehydrogenase n=1 Tax=Rickettsiales endosymbiont of Stachyamoeba lipophora TaxID=2486578 RepID=UPI000F64E213|nr:dihydrolipoyl dehydrogenase [Rickettsiales endosymbiont of Stachyamoeba lipophora]AZL15614.1 dihydrolipoyl dehydrogenase [Rickettsiales endosymbiont of Stachyamoeba lipophora]
MADKFDLVVIGGGPAGYVGSIRAAQLGMKVACVEYRKTLGGTCLNVGCIPSKALLYSSELYEEAKHNFAGYGIEVDNVKLNLAQMLAKKSEVVKTLTKGIEGLFKKNKITHYNGFATLKDNNTIEIKKADGSVEEIKAEKVLIATGSESANLPGIEIDEKNIISSTGALELSKVPEEMIVIGGGYIGLEMGSIWRRLGSKVTVIEFLDRIVPAMDLEVGKEFKKILEKQGIEFKLETKVLSAATKNNKVALEIESVKNGEQTKLIADVVLVSIGRKPFTKNLGLENLGIITDKMGRIETNEHFQTSIQNIYAVGDVIKGPMLAHKAEEEAIAAVEIMAGQAGHVNYDCIPGVVYTHPEVASVGKTEEELQSLNIEYNKGKFPFMANSRAKAVGQEEGFVKILACKKTDEVLGVHIIGPDAGTLIHEAVILMEFRGASEDLARICHAHPTLNEAIKEAALSVLGRKINM